MILVSNIFGGTSKFQPTVLVCFCWVQDQNSKIFKPEVERGYDWGSISFMNHQQIKHAVDSFCCLTIVHPPMLLVHCSLVIKTQRENGNHFNFVFGLAISGLDVVHCM